MFTTKRGFTLIELLVVIAIIGILASIVLVSFPSANNKAKDARIIADMSQIRSLAAEFYTTGNTYTGFVAPTTLTGDIAAKGGTYGAFINTTLQTGQEYCIVTTLNSGGFYCADSGGLIGKTATNTTCVVACQALGTCTCPAGTTL
jgi:prepilin-type N-terminal cleavage/methylation domain-containing protein